MTDCSHNDKSKYVDCATELLAARKEVMRLRTENAELLVKLANAVTETADAIDDMFNDAVQSDLEHGVKWFSENAARQLKTLYPEIFKFSETLRAKYSPQNSNEQSTN